MEELLLPEEPLEPDEEDPSLESLSQSVPLQREFCGAQFWKLTMVSEATTIAERTRKFRIFRKIRLFMVTFPLSAWT